MVVAVAVEEEEERASVDGEVEIAMETVRAACRSSHSSEIETYDESGSVIVSHSAELPLYLYEPDCAIENQIVGYPDSASCRCTGA